MAYNLNTKDTDMHNNLFKIIRHTALTKYNRLLSLGLIILLSIIYNHNIKCASSIVDAIPNDIHNNNFDKDKELDTNADKQGNDHLQLNNQISDHYYSNINNHEDNLNNDFNNFINDDDIYNDIPEESKNKLIEFNFQNENLTEIINYIASKRNINILLPQDPNAINQKITFKPEYKDKVTLQQAWNLLLSFLEINGYTISIQESYYRIIKKNKSTIAQYDYPLYVDTPVDSLPKTDQRIQYLYFFKNLAVPDETFSSANDPISQILKTTLSQVSQVIYDHKVNAAIIIDKANTVSSTMRIIKAFDESGFKEYVEIMPLYYSMAKDVANVLKTLIDTTAENTSYIGNNLKTQANILFPNGTKIVPQPDNNSIILLGRQTAISEIKSFIIDHIDLPQDTGQSILHIYNLQYLDSKIFAETLTKILAGRPEGAQSSGASTSGVIGPERYFKNPIVTSESVIEVSGKKSTKMLESDLTQIDLKLEGQDTSDQQISQGFKSGVFQGGNRLIIAATHEDWRVIENLIRSLDKPSPQVILEVLILNVSTNLKKGLNPAFRSRRSDCFTPENDKLEYLINHLTPTDQMLLCNTPQNCEDIRTFTRDLLSFSGVGSGSSSINSVASYVNLTDPGSMLISFNEDVTNAVWGLYNIIDQFTESKVIDHPLLVTSNNKAAQVVLQETRRGRGAPEPGGGGAITIPVININATRLIQFIPRISTSDQLNLQIKVGLNQFVGSSLTRETRQIETNANMKSGQVLVLGGLSQYTDNDSQSLTPIIANIPILGQFFKSTGQSNKRQNLLILISPTIVQAKLRKGLDLYTTDKIKEMKNDFNDGDIFGHKRQPITRWFFGSQNDEDIVLENYLNDANNAPKITQLLPKKEQERLGLIKPKKELEVKLSAPPPEDKFKKVQAPPA